jgi:hypothetical protein
MQHQTHFHPSKLSRVDNSVLFFLQQYIIQRICTAKLDTQCERESKVLHLCKSHFEAAKVQLSLRVTAIVQVSLRRVEVLTVLTVL